MCYNRTGTIGTRHGIFPSNYVCLGLPVAGKTSRFSTPSQLSLAPSAAPTYSPPLQGSMDGDRNDLVLQGRTSTKIQHFSSPMYPQTSQTMSDMPQFFGGVVSRPLFDSAEVSSTPHSNEAVEEQEFDLQSIVSLNTFHDSALGSSNPSAGSISSIQDLPQSAQQEVLLVLISDKNLRPLIDKAARKTDSDRFTRNIRRALMQYSEDLSKSATEVGEKAAAVILRRHSQWIASSLFDVTNPNRDTSNQRMKDLLKQDVDRRSVLERYLAEKSLHHAPPRIDTTHSKIDEDGESISDMSDEDTEDDPKFPNLDHLKRFLTAGQAFENLKWKISDFIRPERPPIPRKKSLENRHTGPTDKVPELPANATYEELNGDFGMEGVEFNTKQEYPAAAEQSPGSAGSGSSQRSHNMSLAHNRGRHGPNPLNTGSQEFDLQSIASLNTFHDSVLGSSNPSAQGGYYGNALQAASYNGHDQAVQRLLEKGADVNAQGGRYGNALQAASAEGHDQTVRQLLEKGADVNAQGGRYGNALQAASYKGHNQIAQRLLEAGADVNAQGGEYGNALQAAAIEGHDRIVQQLLEAGAVVLPHHIRNQLVPKTRSVMSVGNDSGFFSMSQISADFTISKGVDKLVALLAEDQDMEPLFPRAIKSHGIDSFERNYCRLLQHYSKALWEQAQDDRDKVAAVQLIRMKAPDITRKLRERFDPVGAGNSRLARDMKVGLSQLSQEDVDTDLDRWFREQHVGNAREVRSDDTHEILDDEMGDKRIEDDDNNSEATDILNQEPELSTEGASLATVIEFMTSGIPFRTLKEQFKAWVFQTLQEDTPSDEDILETEGHEVDKCKGKLKTDNAPTNERSDGEEIAEIVTEPTVKSFVKNVTTSSILKNSLIVSRLRKSLAHAFHSIRSLFLSSELPPYITRIRWTCHCGHQSYDDFISERRVVKTIADTMIRSGIKVEIVTRRESGISTLLLLWKNMALGAYRRYPGAYQEPSQSASGHLQVRSSAASAHNLSQDVPGNSQDISEMEFQSTSGEPIQKLKGKTKDDVRFLHLCIHMEFAPPCMKHLILDPKSAPASIINCDYQLFRSIKDLHLEACKRRMTPFVKLKGIYFVQVSRHPKILTLYTDMPSIGYTKRP
jgi:ankyrin repeat protein